MFQEIKGDLLTTNIQYIAHQCNCLSVGQAAGLARFLFDKYPFSNTYKEEIKRTPGTVHVMGNGNTERYIINMYSQYYPGGQHPPKDSAEQRIEWFKMCLGEIANISGLKEIAFPYRIGCGIAGGNWDTYRDVLKKFSEDNLLIDVFIINNE